MRKTVRMFLFFEAATYIIAAFVHAGVLLAGYEHREARIAEGVIATVLLVAAIFTYIRPAWSRQAGLAAQAFALLGTLVGVFTIMIGIGPDTTLDIVYHLAIIAVVVWGLVITRRGNT